MADLSPHMYVAKFKKNRRHPSGFTDGMSKWAAMRKIKILKVSGTPLLSTLRSTVRNNSRNLSSHLHLPCVTTST